MYLLDMLYPITRYLNTYIALYFRTPKLPEKHTQLMETSFHPPLTLVPLLANYPHSHFSPPSLGVPPSHTPFLFIPIFGAPGVWSPVLLFVLLCVRLLVLVPKLPVFIIPLLLETLRDWFHVMITILSEFSIFWWNLGGGGDEFSFRFIIFLLNGL